MEMLILEEECKYISVNLSTGKIQIKDYCEDIQIVDIKDIPEIYQKMIDMKAIIDEYINKKQNKI